MMISLIIFSLLLSSIIAIENLEFKSTTSSCRDEDNSTNITISCTLSCGHPQIKIFGTFNIESLNSDFKLYEKYRIDAFGNQSDYQPCENDNSSDNITVIVKGAISGMKRLNNSDKCSYMLECDDLEGGIPEVKSFTYEDCAITDGNCDSEPPNNCSVTITETLSIIKTLTVQPSPTVVDPTIITMDCSSYEETIIPSSPNACFCTSRFDVITITEEKTVSTTVTTTSIISQTTDASSSSDLCSAVTDFQATTFTAGISSGSALIFIVVLLIVAIIVLIILLIRKKSRSHNFDARFAIQNPSAELDKSSTIKNSDVNASVPA